jgi:hypothetical protein
LLARCSQPLSTNQTPHPTTKRGDNNHTRKTPGATPERAITAPGSPKHRAKKQRGPVVSKPNSVSSESPPARTPHKGTPRKTGTVCCAPEPHPLQVKPIQRIAHTHRKSHTVVGGA